MELDTYVPAALQVQSDLPLYSLRRGTVRLATRCRTPRLLVIDVATLRRKSRIPRLWETIVATWIIEQRRRSGYDGSRGEVTETSLHREKKRDAQEEGDIVVKDEDDRLSKGD
ncbi:hypothetical protein B296_00010769 [Ensete ventricosum]|uniref:Uncharacterized protein n=1 Tax=Ensete ventricosum TaxID=4639 RepID=A0A426ZNY4_ENSVE|nr:hypothetical protein B296_00010769 [Ensete ventricosum]